MRIRFEPKEDITAYELAIIYGNICVSSSPMSLNLISISATNEDWEEMSNIKGQNIQRHFRIVD